MSIKSGKCYKISNEEKGVVIDMAPWEWHTGSGGGKSVIGWPPHGGRNQQWIIEKQDDEQWAIRSVQHQKYVGSFSKTPKDGTFLDGLDKPQLWDIEILPDSENHDNLRVRFWVRNTLLVIEFPREQDSVPLQLWSARDNGKNQVWVLEEYP